MTNHTGKIAAAIIVAALAGLVASGCTNGTPSASGQKVIDVLCKGDALVQPIVVPVIVMAAPATGPVAPAVAAGVALDTALIHPAIVKACADYMAKPVAVVAEPPPGAVVAAPVVVTAPPAKP